MEIPPAQMRVPSVASIREVDVEEAPAPEREQENPKRPPTRNTEPEEPEDHAEGGAPDGGDDGDDDGPGGPRGGGPVPRHQARTPDDAEIGARIFSGLNDLTTVLRSLSGANSAPVRSSRSNLRNLEPFDGSDPSKLPLFLSQCGLHFAERVQDFPSDDDHIIFVLSYLKGAAAAWFQPAMFATDSTVPDWDGNFSLFIQELMSVFGPHDLSEMPKANSERFE
ncbi:hypothetical protein DFH07DRAFT_949987 [Mycena maculata]|uniref:DUF4939 domain-containing protein n=1 Tax=Mycena maculata TaxID=230809 RepID=A0AAD7KDA2_9AGAR|nr:hypothetical protein DFH07DRAFT_949987 [Mycena maculata]